MVTKTLFVGAFNHANSGALHVLDYDTSSGGLTLRSTFDGVPNPAWLVPHPHLPIVYAASEISGGKGNPQPVGRIAALDFDRESRTLTLLDDRSSLTPRPCHVSLDRSARMLFAANYFGASVAAFPVAQDGRLGEANLLVEHHGTSVHPVRQTEPHPHGCFPDPFNEFLYVVDLGLDRIATYRMDVGACQLAALPDLDVRLPPSSGPRHLAFHPAGHHAYLVNEMGASVTVLSFDAKNGRLAPVQDISTLPEGYTGQKWCSAIAIAPSGRTLLAANRGHDSIAMLRIDRSLGKLSLLNIASVSGRTPRDFVIDPDGRRVIVCNQDSNALAVFVIDEDAGTLELESMVEGVTKPACAVFEGGR